MYDDTNYPTEGFKTLNGEMLGRSPKIYPPFEYGTEWTIGEIRGDEVYREETFIVTEDYNEDNVCIMTITPKEGMDIKLEFKTLYTDKEQDKFFKENLDYVEEWRIKETIKDLKHQFRFTMVEEYVSMSSGTYKQTGGLSKQSYLGEAGITVDPLDRLNHKDKGKTQTLREYLEEKGMYDILDILTKEQEQGVLKTGGREFIEKHLPLMSSTWYKVSVDFLEENGEDTCLEIEKHLSMIDSSEREDVMFRIIENGEKI